MKNNFLLICFALKEEAAHFRPRLVPVPCKCVIVGVGAKNAGKSFRAAIANEKPRLVVTAGYAGGLNPKLTIGKVLFDEDNDAGLGEKLLEAGAMKGRFHCASRVATTATDKWQLWQSTGADAVEMESEIIRNICREQKIPSATVRVISDVAGEDLPLDFNAFMTPDERLDYLKLAGHVMKKPGKIGELLRLRRQTTLAARNLGETLQKSLAGLR